ncbi:hypothetical protein Tco_0577987 [Tanacetum coccineum]
MHRTTSAPRSPNPKTDEGESSAPQKSTVIRLHTIQLSLAEQKSHDELEAKQNVQKVEEHLIVEEIEKLDDPYDDAHPEGENSAKRHKTFEHRTFVSSSQDYESEPGPSTLGNQEQVNDFNFWMDSYATDDDEIPNEKVLQELVDEMSYTVDEAKLRKVTYWELGHEHKFITEIVARRANSSIVSITESDYKKLNKNDIKDMYLLIVNHKVDDYVEIGLLWSLSVFIRSTVILERVHNFQLGVERYQQKVNLTAPTITFPDIENYKVFSIISEPVYGIIYKNSKKEKRVMRHQEVHKLCDATLKRVLEGLKSYNNDVEHGYVTPSLSNEDAEYL